MKPIIRALAWGLLFLGLVRPGWAQDPLPFQASVDALVQTYLKAAELQGLSIGIVKGEQTWILHYGTLGVASEQIPDDRTVYEIGSISKVFTSLLLAKAVVEERLTLDQRIGSLLPTLAGKNPTVGAGISLQQLSQHTSGLPRMPFNLHPKDANNPYADYGRVPLVELMEVVRPPRKPGEKQVYSNLGAGLLGDLLSMQAGVPYGTLLETSLLQPLGMGDTGVQVPPVEGRSFALPHASGLFPNHHWDFDALVGAGGIRSTAKDMVAFLRAWLHPPEGKLGEAMELAWKESLPAQDGDPAMGLGWMIASNAFTHWHNGMTGGYQSILYVDRKHDAGVVLLSNTADSLGDRLGDQVLRTILGEKVEPTNFEPGPEWDPKELQRLPGRYQLNRDTVIEVIVKGGRMQAQFTGQQALRLDPVDLKTWKYRGVQAKLTFDLDKGGLCLQVIHHQNGRWTKASRIR